MGPILEGIYRSTIISFLLAIFLEVWDEVSMEHLTLALVLSIIGIFAGIWSVKESE